MSILPLVTAKLDWAILERCQALCEKGKKVKSITQNLT